MAKFRLNEDEETVEPIVAIDEHSWQINGTVTITDLEEAIGLEIPDCDSDTFNGFAMGLYGSIPEDGSTFEVSTDLFDIQVLQISEHRIESAILTVKEQNDEEDEDSSKAQKADATL